MTIIKNILSIISDIIIILAMLYFIGFMDKLANKLDEPDKGRVVRLVEKGKK